MYVCLALKHNWLSNYVQEEKKIPLLIIQVHQLIMATGVSVADKLILAVLMWVSF